MGDCARQLRTQRVNDTRREPRHVRDNEPWLSDFQPPSATTLLGVLDSEDAQVAFYDARYEKAFEAIADCGAARL